MMPPPAAPLPVYDGPPPSTMAEGMSLINEVGTKYSELSEETNAAILALQADVIAAADAETTTAEEAPLEDAAEPGPITDDIREAARDHFRTTKRDAIRSLLSKPDLNELPKLDPAEIDVGVDVLAFTHPNIARDLLRPVVYEALGDVITERRARVSILVNESTKNLAGGSARTVRRIVNDPREGIIRKREVTYEDRDGLKKTVETGSDDVFRYYLESATVNINPIDTSQKTYSLLFRDRQRRYLTLSYDEQPLPFIQEDLLGRPGVSARRILPDALTGILGELESLGRITTVQRPPATGFFEDEDGGIYFSQSRRFEVDLPEFVQDLTRDALKFLDTVMRFYAVDGDWTIAENRDHFLTGLNFYIQAPLGTIRKRRGRENRILLLGGEPHLGKTWLEKIGCRIWGVPFERGIRGGSKLTPPQLAELFDKTTLPMAIDEVRKILSNPTIADMLKNSTTTFATKDRILAREGFRVQNFMAYASIAMSANYIPELYLGMSDRLIPVTFTAKNRRDPEIAKVFERELTAAYDLLPHIGSGIRQVLLSDWMRVQGAALQDDQIEAGRQLLEGLYRYVGLDVPEWLQQVETSYDVEERDPVEEVCKFLADDLLKRLQLGVPRDAIPTGWDERLETLRAKNLTPSYLVRISDENIVLSNDVISELEKRGIEIAGGLTGLMDRIQTFARNLQRKPQTKLAPVLGRRAVYLDVRVFFQYVGTEEESHPDGDNE